MRKRTESTIVTSILKYLQIHENLGNILWCDRLNSGKFKMEGRFIRGHRAGTPDIFVILKYSSDPAVPAILWVEAKTGKGRQSREQASFQRMILESKNQVYIMAKSVADVERYLKMIGAI